MYTFDINEIEQQVFNFMRSIGCEPIHSIALILDGHIHRYNVIGDKGRDENGSGAYCIFTDNWPAGWIHNWRTGIHETWTFDRNRLDEAGKSYFDDEKYKELLKKAKIQQERFSEELRSKQAQASDNARSMFSALPPAPEDFPYLIKKNVPCYGLRYRRDFNQIAVPLRNINGDIQSIQWIDADGGKKFFEGAPTTGAFWCIGLDTLKPNDNNSVILVGEGYATMATVYELTGLPCVAAMTCRNLLNVGNVLHNKFKNVKIIFIADNDHNTDGNPGITCASEADRAISNAGIVFPHFSNAQSGTDWNDFLLLHGSELTAYILKDKINFASLPKKTQELLKRVEVVNAQVLRQTVLPPLKWAIDGFLPAGLTILAGSPKVGKSILALHIALAVATGGCALGKIFVQKGEVLYLALEDNKRRIQERINGSDLDANVDISCLDIAYSVPRQNDGGLAYIEFWLVNHKNARLVIIDTLQMFRTQLSGKGHMYSEDYDVISEIKKLADKYDVPFLIIHHLKKAKENEDWINEFSGSQGIAGAADTLFSLKRSRSQAVGILHRTGRDVEEKDFAMTLDGFGWVLQGEAEQFTMPEWKRQILDFLKEHDSVTPAELATAFNLTHKTAHKNLQKLMREGSIKKTGYGTYSINE
ncbi:MAG: AAA family ATPase [Synergistaceae bacterium]|nr:AAA family ATPase [Synergistaceae bacterium]